MFFWAYTYDHKFIHQSTYELIKWVERKIGSSYELNPKSLIFLVSVLQLDHQLCFPSAKPISVSQEIFIVFQMLHHRTS